MPFCFHGFWLPPDDVLADLRRRVALALVGEERLHRLVHHRHVDHAVERRLGQRDLLARRAVRRVRGRLLESDWSSAMA